jgi:8-oxo-dGTP pyrophosphatase MutT (NUDIX family)
MPSLLEAFQDLTKAKAEEGKPPELKRKIRQRRKDKPAAVEPVEPQAEVTTGGLVSPHPIKQPGEQYAGISEMGAQLRELQSRLDPNKAGYWRQIDQQLKPMLTQSPEEVGRLRSQLAMSAIKNHLRAKLRLMTGKLPTPIPEPKAHDPEAGTADVIPGPWHPETLAASEKEISVVPEAEIKEADQEINKESLEQIQRKTARKWAARAIASFRKAAESKDPSEIFERYKDGEDHRHEALEHASLIKDHGKLLNLYQDVIERERQKVNLSLLGVKHEALGKAVVHMPPTKPQYVQKQEKPAKKPFKGRKTKVGARARGTEFHHDIPVAENLEWHLRNLWETPESIYSGYRTIREVPKEEYHKIHARLARKKFRGLIKSEDGLPQHKMSRLGVQHLDNLKNYLQQLKDGTDVREMPLKQLAQVRRSTHYLHDVSGSLDRQQALMRHLSNLDAELARRVGMHDPSDAGTIDRLVNQQLNKNSDAIFMDAISNPLLNRIEDKYFIPYNKLGDLTHVLKTNLPNADNDTSVRFNRNRTIYLDNDDMDAFRDGMERIKPRFKVRIRQYSPNNEGFEDVAYVELKIKAEGDMTNKVRIRIPASIINNVCDGKEIDFSDELVEMNREIPRDNVRKRVAMINSVIHKYGFQKQLEVQYDRRAYSSNDIRVTVDDNLEYMDAHSIGDEAKAFILESSKWKKMRKQVHKLVEKNYVIMEVKHEGKVPDWLRKVLKDVGAKQVRFSKYCGAVVTQILSGESFGDVSRSRKISHDAIQEMVAESQFKKSEGLVKSTADIAVVLVRDGHFILCGRRRKNGKWGLPGGRFERDDTGKREAALRELEEETGLKIDRDGLKYEGFSEVEGKHERKRVHVFMAKHPGGEPTTEHDPDKEFTEWQWIRCEHGKLPESIVDDDMNPPTEAAFDHLGMTKTESDDEKYDREQREVWRKKWATMSYRQKQDAMRSGHGPDTAVKRRAREAHEAKLKEMIQQIVAKKPPVQKSEVQSVELSPHARLRQRYRKNGKEKLQKEFGPGANSDLAVSNMNTNVSEAPVALSVSEKKP